MLCISLAIVDVDVEIRNCSETEDVTFSFETLSPQLVFDSAFAPPSQHPSHYHSSLHAHHALNHIVVVRF